MSTGWIALIVVVGLMAMVGLMMFFIEFEGAEKTKIFLVGKPRPPRPDHYLMGMRLKDPVQIDGQLFEICQWDSYGIQLRKVPKKEILKTKFGKRTVSNLSSQELETAILHHQEANGLMVGQRVSVNGDVFDFVEYGNGERYTDGRDRIILRPWDRKAYTGMWI